MLYFSFLSHLAARIFATEPASPETQVHIQGSGVRVQGSGFRVQGSGVRGQGSGCRVQGSGFRGRGAGCERASPGTQVHAPHKGLVDLEDSC